jgi:hypothetical protein
MEDLLNRLFGKNHDESSKKLDIALLQIQEKYKKWFDENIGNDENEEKRSILYYRTLYFNPPYYQFGIKIDNMPEQIEHECYEKFREIFG